MGLVALWSGLDGAVDDGSRGICDTRGVYDAGIWSGYLTDYVVSGYYGQLDKPFQAVKVDTTHYRINYSAMAVASLFIGGGGDGLHHH